MKSPRLSVQVPPELRTHLRRLGAENGRSLSANFAELAIAGTQKTTIESELSQLKTLVRGQRPDLQLHDVLAELKILRQELAQKPAQEVGFPQKTMALICTEAIFAGCLCAEILNAEMPGTPYKPAAYHIRAARQKAETKLREFGVEA